MMEAPGITVSRFRPKNGSADDGNQFDEANASLGQTPEKRRFELIPFKDIVFGAGTRWLVKGLLASTGLAVIFGPPKQYKSFVAADVALHVAAGHDWAGRRVKQGAVVYIVGEGQAGFSDRIAANRLKRAYPEDLPFFLVKARPNLGIGDGDRVALVEAIAPVMASIKQPLAAVFIDTLARTLAGSNENDEGMRNFTDNAEAIADHFDCLAVAVHHTGKDTTKGMRGSSALHGAVVSSWKVEKAKDFQAQITLEDAKDGESGLTWTADLERYVYGHDEDGDEKSVLLVQKVSDPAPEGQSAKPDSVGKPVAVPPQLKLFMSCLEAAAATSSRPARPFHDGPEIRVTPIEAVRLEYYARRADEATMEAKKKAFQNNQKIGVERRLILIQDVGGEKVVWKKNG